MLWWSLQTLPHHGLETGCIEDTGDSMCRGHWDAPGPLGNTGKLATVTATERMPLVRGCRSLHLNFATNARSDPLFFSYKNKLFTIWDSVKKLASVLTKTKKSDCTVYMLLFAVLRSYFECTLKYTFHLKS